MFLVRASFSGNHLGLKPGFNFFPNPEFFGNYSCKNTYIQDTNDTEKLSDARATFSSELKLEPITM